MLDIATICSAVASALAADAALAAYCVERYGRAPRVCLGAVGTLPRDGAEGDEPLCPYLEIAPSEDATGGGEANVESGTVGILVCADASDRPEGWEDASKPAAASGVYAAKWDSDFAGLVALVRATACKDGHGALYKTQRTSYDGVTAYPVSYAAIAAEFYHIAAW